MEYSFATVALEDINQTDRSFKISTTRDKTPLLESIRSIGVLVPPALWRRGSDWIIVSGFRRIAACQQAGCKAVAARVLADHQTPLDCLRLAVIENTSQRALNLIEAARAVSQLKHLCGNEDTFKDALTPLGLPASSRMIAKLDQLIQLDDDLQTAILDGVVGLDVALTIGAMPPEDRSIVLTLFKQVPMSASKQREILLLATDIAGRDRKSITAVLQADAIRSTADDIELDRNTKSARIRRLLKQIRYPNLFQAETRYHNTVAKLRLGPQMRIDPPEGFEGLTYTFLLRFKTCSDLARAHQKLGAAIQNPAIKELFPE